MAILILVSIIVFAVAITERKNLKSAAAWALLGSVLLVVGIMGAIKQNAPEHAEASKPVAVVNEKPLRQEARTYWENVIFSLAVTSVYIQHASDALQSGDTVTMQQYLTQAQKSADTAYTRAENDEPAGDTWMNVQSELMDASGTLKDAIGTMKDALDSGSSEKAAQALDSVQSAMSNVASATHQARTWYVAHGGHSSDLDDLPTAARSVKSLTDALR